jgi:chemotaxis protein CheD
MNHFLLPGDIEKNSSMTADANRYGVNAMEYLINEILKRGGLRNRLEVKVFGGGNVIASSAMIGDKNAAFVRHYLKAEGLHIASEDLCGDLPRRVHYYPDTGKVMMRRLQRTEDKEVIEYERAYEQALRRKAVEGDVELF